MRKLDARQLAREKSLFRYSSALERADFSTVATVLHEAERDPLLAQMIAEINAVYENETFRLSPSLNHSSNHQKDVLMTTIMLPDRQRTMQRWLPVTLVAACVSVLFIGALMLRPIRPNNNLQAGISASATPTAAASPTLVPSPLPTFTATPIVGIIEPTVVPQEAHPALLCWGTIGEQPVQVYSRPALSGTGVAVNMLKPQTNVIILDVDNQAGNATAWYFVQGNSDGKDVQGWVSTAYFTDINNCPEMATMNTFTVIIPTPVPVITFQLATVVPPDVMTVTIPPIPANPTAYFDNVMRSNPPVIVITRAIGGIPANTQVQIESAGFDGTAWTYQLRSADGQLVTIAQADLMGIVTLGSAGTTGVVQGICSVVNQQRDSVQIYSAPSSKGDESVLVNNLPPNMPATVLYQRQNKETGVVWYLILAVAKEGKEISGWVSSDSVHVVDRCPSLP